MRTSYVLLLAIGLCLILSCRKESFITGSEAVVNISQDSLYFDTLFTSTGSVSQAFKIYNKNSRKLKISSIRLNGGASSFFRINADGFSGPEVRDLEMEANDSLYVFVTVSVDPTTSELPFIIEDSISIQFNGNQQQVKLSAWGQNAVFLNSVLVAGDFTFTNEKPYVILGGLLVDEAVTLTIEKGTQIYLHADAPFLVDGTLIAEGEKYDSTKIIFQGDRLDHPYRNYPGAWPGIYFREKSRNSIMKHVIVKNAYQGIVAEGSADEPDPKIILDQCIIDNCYDAGLLGVGTTIEAVNCLISNCGKNILLLKGGRYHFTHCTDVAIGNPFIPHKQPVLAIADFLQDGNSIITGALEADFTNCIFWGDNGTVDNEVVTIREGVETFNVRFKGSLWKNLATPDGVTASDMIENADPLFEEIDTRNRLYDFRLQTGSPAIDAGIITGIATDLDENTRDVNFPDIGAYETTF